MTTPVLNGGVAGPFIANWNPDYTQPHSVNSANLGIIGARGIREIIRHEGEEIPADLLGMTVIDTVYLGAQAFIEFELESANLLAVSQIHKPFAEVTDVTQLTQYMSHEFDLGVPGTFHSDVAGSLLLTPAYGTGGSALNTAGAQTTPVRKYGICTLAAGFELTKLLASRRRTIPIRLRCYPYQFQSRYVFGEKS